MMTKNYIINNERNKVVCSVVFIGKRKIRKKIAHWTYVFHPTSFLPFMQYNILNT